MNKNFIIGLVAFAIVLAGVSLGMNISGNDNSANLVNSPKADDAQGECFTSCTNRPGNQRLTREEVENCKKRCGFTTGGGQVQCDNVTSCFFGVPGECDCDVDGSPCPGEENDCSTGSGGEQCDPQALCPEQDNPDLRDGRCACNCPTPDRDCSGSGGGGSGGGGRCDDPYETFSRTQKMCVDCNLDSPQATLCGWACLTETERPVVTEAGGCGCVPIEECQ